MREIVSICSNWNYLPDFREAFLDPAVSLAAWQGVSLPHTNIELPYNGFDEGTYQFVSCYARDLEVSARGPGRRAFLDFEGVMAACELWIDGQRLGGHEGGFTPFSFEVTDFLADGKRHRLVVRVDSTERRDFPPHGHVVDYLTYGGIYREVNLRLQDFDYISDAFARPSYRPGEAAGLEVDVAVDAASLDSGTKSESPLRLVAALRKDGREFARSDEVAAAPGLFSFAMTDLDDIEPWDIDSPVLYDLELLLMREGRTIDSLTIRVGFREARFAPEGFFLNGRAVPLIGLNRHQSWPYVGYAMPARAQRRDAEILKRELGLNIVRTSHYPQSRHFLDACDEFGLLVFEEMPGWQHIGNATWKDAAARFLEAMIRRDRNHPSICLWGVRINESTDDHQFYARTNELARRLDPTRQTGGVRFIDKSELLEDVYTYNDFIHAGGAEVLRKPGKVLPRGLRAPYLVTEHNGHMFPAKRFDNEERVAEQAHRHLSVLNAARAIPGISGAIGWCAFDYNTHKEFGSGDRICYHGVMDMFRIPKYAAFAYASQKPPSKGIVLEAASLFAKGERSSARLLPIHVYTNCDEIILYRNDLLVGRYFPERDEFPRLPHPPVIIRDLIGDQLDGSSFSPRDRKLIRSLAGKVLAEGFEGLSWLDLARFGILLLKYRMNLADAEKLVAGYALGWGSKEDRFQFVGLVDGVEAARRTYGGDAYASRLSIAADDTRLSAGAWDCTRVEVRLEDQYGNLCPYVAETVDIEVKGPGAVIGPTRVALIGGCVAYWVRTSGSAGTITTIARSARFASAEIRIQVAGSGEPVSIG